MGGEGVGAEAGGGEGVTIHSAHLVADLLTLRVLVTSKMNQSLNATGDVKYSHDSSPNGFTEFELSHVSDLSDVI